jgi:hypothetical protein
MGVRRYSRATAGLCGAVASLVVLGGTLEPALQGSAHPVRLEPGQWYVVAPVQASSARTPVSFEPAPVPMARSAASGHELPAAVSGSESFLPAGSAVWLALSGLIVVLTASLIRPGKSGLGSLIRRSRNRGAVFTEGSE